MNYLLVMPRFVDTVGEWYQFPLGIPYVSSSMKQAGLNVFTLNMNSREGVTREIMEEEIEKHAIDVVLTGGLSFQYPAIREILQAAKEVDPRIVTVAGGGIITSAPAAGMEVLEFADYGIVGEGEETTPALCHALERGEDVMAVEGIVYRDDGVWLRTKARKEVANLDAIPFPDYDGFDFSKIAAMVPSLLGMNEDHAITMTTSRSCPFQCTFCFHTSGSHYRKRSLDNFFEELDLLVEKYHIKYIFVSDELFAINMQRVVEFCARIKPYNIRWWAQFRVCDVTEKMVRILKDSNCVTMGFGLESADDGILRSMNKKIRFEQTEKALALAYQYGLTIQGGFIFGDVEETIETAKRTLDWWKAHTEYGITLNFITTYPGTPLYKTALARGIIKDEVQFIRDGCPVVNLSKMTKEEMDWLAGEVMRLPQRAFLPPDGIHDVKVDYARRALSFTGACTECSEENRWESVRFFTRNVLTCKKCGKKHKLPILPEIVRYITYSVETLREENGKIAFWGINDYFATMIPDLSFVGAEGVFLIDNSKIKQGSEVDGHLIHSPNILDEEEIDTVIVPVISLMSTIEKQIHQAFPRVKNIINILDLVKPIDEKCVG